MKTLTKILFAAALSGAAISYAGPGPQFWNRPAPKPAPAKSQTAAPTSEVPAPADNSNLMCKTMLVPRQGGGKVPGYVRVNCTPEMMQKDWRCQQACARAMKKG